MTGWRCLCCGCSTLMLLGWSVLSHAAELPELVIVSNEYPPYVSEQPGQGSLVEIFQAIGQEMGVRFVFRFLPWNRCEQAVADESAWGAIPYVPTPERLQKFNFSDRIYTRQARFFYLSSDERPKDIAYETLADLKPFTIGGVLGYYYEKPLRDAGLRLDLALSEEQNMRKLLAGRFTLAISDETVGWYLLRKIASPEELRRVFALTKPFNVSDNFLMTSKNYPNGEALLKRFNAAMKRVKDKGGFKAVLDKNGLTMTY